METDRPRITSQKSQFTIFQVLKKGYIEMTEKIYLETFEKCPGSLCFPLLWILFKVKIEFFIRKLENQRDWEQKKVCLIESKILLQVRQRILPNRIILSKLWFR